MNNLTNKPKNIFIDCTATYYTGLNTGIQRVVRNVIERIDYIEETFGIKCTPVILKENEFIAISKEELLSRKPNPNVLKAKALLSKILPSKIYMADCFCCLQNHLLRHRQLSPAAETFCLALMYCILGDRIV